MYSSDQYQITHHVQAPDVCPNGQQLVEAQKHREQQLSGCIWSALEIESEVGEKKDVCLHQFRELPQRNLHPCCVHHVQPRTVDSYFARRNFQRGLKACENTNDTREYGELLRLATESHRKAIDSIAIEARNTNRRLTQPSGIG